MTDAVERVREAHTENPCRVCGTPYPCPVRRTLDSLEGHIDGLEHRLNTLEEAMREMVEMFEPAPFPKGPPRMAWERARDTLLTPPTSDPRPGLPYRLTLPTGVADKAQEAGARRKTDEEMHDLIPGADTPPTGDAE